MPSKLITKRQWQSPDGETFDTLELSITHELVGLGFGKEVAVKMIGKRTDIVEILSQSESDCSAVSAPSTWAERVIKLFEQAENKPLMQKQVMELYQKTGWPMPPDRADLYRVISGTIAYLFKKKGVLDKMEDGYILK